MSTILCLAHYCDTHGPTPLMVTECLPVPCSTCYEDDDDVSSQRRGSISRSIRSNPGIEHMSRSHRRAGSTDSVIEAERQLALAQAAATSNTPPDSPRMAALHNMRNNSRHRRDSSFRKTYDDNDRKRAIPCDNCALTLPKKLKDQMYDSGLGSPTKDSQALVASPVLRTRRPYARVTETQEGSPKSTSTMSDSDEALATEPRRRRPLSRTATFSTVCSSASSSSETHNHFVDYTSTHDPQSSASFAILRASCLRTLSCENVPPSASSMANPSPYSTRPILSNAANAGGTIMFGDPLAGYTTAFIFRIPDPYARGRRRIYSFMCLQKVRERTTMQVFSFLSSAFQDLATWIQSLAEMEADREDSAIHSSSSEAESSLGSLPYISRIGGKKATPTSSFLSGRPCDPDGIPRRGLLSAPRSRGLAELVGLPEFFIELHARFVALLAQLSQLLAGTA